ncbi:hypothetical protein Nepgr_001972 [Nepenthes gracilis]|uniref:Uncharacterized protein n=1 Tax=Nepenthes gracilis TaxID=150966 RepID=A0AAD3P640_NEPGR|nr:hypothetical protein Nepgr_001972 [Nepenthes gracilis]
MTLYICITSVASSWHKRHQCHCHSLLSVPVYFFSTFPRKSPKPIAEYLIKRHNFSPETASKASSLLPHLKSYRKSDLILEYLKQSGFSMPHLEKLIERVPHVLLSCLDRTIKPKIQMFHDLGFSSYDIADLLSADPCLLTRRSASRLGRSVRVLKSVLGSDSCVLKALKACNWFLKRDLDETLVPNVEHMIGCGISPSQISPVVCNFPRFFLHSPEIMKEFVKRVDEMGIERSSKMFIHAVRVVSSMSINKWKLKLKLFRRLGFSEEDILKAFRSSPQVFAVSDRKILEVVDILLCEGKVDISFLIKHPSLVTYSVENRIKPRLKVVDFLKANNLLVRQPRLTTVCKISEKNFYMKYVIPHYALVGELYTSTLT